jgi:hypothetical protein
VMSSCDSFRRTSIRHIDTELIAAAAAAGMAMQAGIETLGRIPADRLGSHPSPGHANIDKTTIIIPNSVDPRPETGDVNRAPT